MKYLVVQDWPSTSGNHAGMRHMCEMLKCFYPSDYEVIVKECPGTISNYENVWIRRFMVRYDRLVRRQNATEVRYRYICREMFKKLKKGDEVFLLEYMDPAQSQLDLAWYLRKNFPFVKIYSLAHLCPSMWGHEKFASIVEEWQRPVDKLLTLGSSLSAFYEACQIDKGRISTGFHYVDHWYYHPEAVAPHDRVRAIAMGSMLRNYKLLAEIVKRTPKVDWCICNGRNQVETLFQGLDNVQLTGFISEDELRHCMAQSDISVNVMGDTVGSNVVTTSLAMGLAMVCSDVGSIRDYCTERNAYFCANTPEAFADAITGLVEDKMRMNSMKVASRELSQRLHIENVHKWFCSL